MKKILSILIVAIITTMAVACSSSSAQADAVAQKIEQNEELTQEDYSVMLTYVNECFDFTIKKLKDLDNVTPEQLEALDAESAEKYPHIDAFNKVISKLNENDLDDANKELYKKYSGKIIELLQAMS